MITQEQYPFSTGDNGGKGNPLKTILLIIVIGSMVTGIIALIANVIRKNRENKE